MTRFFCAWNPGPRYVPFQAMSMPFFSKKQASRHPFGPYLVPFLQAARLRPNGFKPRATSPNYYDDLEARFTSLSRFASPCPSVCRRLATMSLWTAYRDGSGTTTGTPLRWSSIVLTGSPVAGAATDLIYLCFSSHIFPAIVMPCGEMSGSAPGSRVLRRPLVLNSPTVAVVANLILIGRS